VEIQYPDPQHCHTVVHGLVGAEIEDYCSYCTRCLPLCTPTVPASTC
jgi:hypothetical protein